MTLITATETRPTLDPNLTPAADATGDTPDDGPVIPLARFIDDFGPGLLAAAACGNPPVYTRPDPVRAALLDGLKRPPFAAQHRVIQAVLALLRDAGEKAAVIPGVMGARWAPARP